MINGVSIGFTDLAKIGERIEEGRKNGKIVNPTKSSNNTRKSSNNFQNKKEGETNVMSTEKEDVVKGNHL